MSAFSNEVDDEVYEVEEVPVLPVPSGGEDWEGAAEAKTQATEAKSAGNYEQAVELYTKAMELGGASTLTLANRADCLLRGRRPNAALADCNEALKLNPDSAKALRCRGQVNRRLGNWEAANKDLSAAQSIDFDPDTEPVRKFVTSKAAELEAERVQQRIEEEEALREKVRKQRAELAEQRKREEEEEAARREAEAGAGMGGFPGGMPGMDGAGGMDIQQMIMQLLMSDPELAAGMQNPKVMKAFGAMMGGGDAAAAEMNDPEVKAFMEKFQAKLGPLMGMMGGMGGMGNMGGMPEGDDEDDMPDLEEDPMSAPAVEEVD